MFFLLKSDRLLWRQSDIAVYMFSFDVRPAVIVHVEVPDNSLTGNVWRPVTLPSTRLILASMNGFRVGVFDGYAEPQCAAPSLYLTTFAWLELESLFTNEWNQAGGRSVPEFPLPENLSERKWYKSSPTPLTAVSSACTCFFVYLPIEAIPSIGEEISASLSGPPPPITKHLVRRGYLILFPESGHPGPSIAEHILEVVAKARKVPSELQNGLG